MSLIQCPECQKEVSSTAVSCPYCGYGVKKHFEDIEFARLEQERLTLKTEKSKKRNKLLKFIIPVSVIVIGGLVGVVVNHIILSDRTVFSTDSEMLKYLTSRNCWQLDDLYTDEWLVFNSNGLAEHIEGGKHGNNYGNQIEMSPQKGEFKIEHEEYVISNEGKIVNKKYKDEYYIPNYSPAHTNSIMNDLKLEVISSTYIRDDECKTQIKVTNTGNRTYKFIRLKTTLSNEAGESITLDDDEIVVSDSGSKNYEIAPGKTGTCTTFAINIPSEYKSGSASVKEYRVSNDN